MRWLPSRLLDRDRHTLLVAVAVALASVVPLAGCSTVSDSLDDGTAGGAQSGEVCWTQTARAIGSVWVDNVGTDTVVLESVTLGGSGSAPLLSLSGSYIIRSPQEQMFGFGLEVPPDRYDDPSINAQWEMREQLKGAEISPGEGVNIVIAVMPNENGEGGSEWFDIHYRVGLLSHTHRTNAGLQFDPSPTCSNEG